MLANNEEIIKRTLKKFEDKINANRNVVLDIDKALMTEIKWDKRHSQNIPYIDNNGRREDVFITLEPVTIVECIKNDYMVIDNVDPRIPKKKKSIIDKINEFLTKHFDVKIRDNRLFLSFQGNDKIFTKDINGNEYLGLDGVDIISKLDFVEFCVQIIYDDKEKVINFYIKAAQILKKEPSFYTLRNSFVHEKIVKVIKQWKMYAERRKNSRKRQLIELGKDMWYSPNPKILSDGTRVFGKGFLRGLKRFETQK